MATVFDVAAYILARRGEMTAWKLQKLAYYSQAWSLVWDQRPIFPERIEAWANGPVSPALFKEHVRKFKVSQIAIGNPHTLTREERETVDAVLDYYGDMHPQVLSDLTHSEAPWKDAREGLPPGAKSDREITHASMAEFYEALPIES
jgi:uncharacterized phage-associated protein